MMLDYTVTNYYNYLQVTVRTRLLCNIVFKICLWFHHASDQMTPFWAEAELATVVQAEECP